MSSQKVTTSLGDMRLHAHAQSRNPSLTATPVRPPQSERLLYAVGAIAHGGSVDAGTTQADSLELERERGLRPRQRVRVSRGGEAKATSIQVFAPAGAPAAERRRCGRDGDDGVSNVPATAGVWTVRTLLVERANCALDRSEDPRVDG